LALEAPVEFQGRACQLVAGGEDQEHAVSEEERDHQKQRGQAYKELVWIPRGSTRTEDQQHKRADKGEKAQGKVEDQAQEAGRFDGVFHRIILYRRGEKVVWCFFGGSNGRCTKEREIASLRSR